jgi:hypothetical protein
LKKKGGQAGKKEEETQKTNKLLALSAPHLTLF